MAVVRQQFRSLGALLVEKGLLTRTQLATALEEQKHGGEKLGRILVARGWVRERDIHVVLNGMMVVVFQIGGLDFGVETLLVREIIRLPAVRPLPGAPPWLDGLSDYRGQVVPVVDLNLRLGHVQALGADSVRVIVYEGPGGRVWGLKVDSVSAVTQIPSEQLEDAPRTGEVNGVPARWLAGVARLEGTLIALLDTGELLAEGARESAAALAKGGMG